MHTLQLEISDEIYQTLQDLARKNATDLPTLMQLQAEALAKAYRNAGSTKGLSMHLAESIELHRQLLQRLAE